MRILPVGIFKKASVGTPREMIMNEIGYAAIGDVVSYVHDSFDLTPDQEKALEMCKNVREVYEILQINDWESFALGYWEWLRS